MRTWHCIGFLCLFAACTKKVTQQELIDDAVVLRLDQWRIAVLADCREKAMERADLYVDSVLLARSLDMKLDTIPKPIKPIRPEKPPFRETPDTLKVKKLLSDQ